MDHGSEMRETFPATSSITTTLMNHCLAGSTDRVSTSVKATATTNLLDLITCIKYGCDRNPWKLPSCKGRRGQGYAYIYIQSRIIMNSIMHYTAIILIPVNKPVCLLRWAERTIVHTVRAICRIIHIENRSLSRLHSLPPEDALKAVIALPLVNGMVHKIGTDLCSDDAVLGITN